ncbi:hypothetical protein [Methylocystis sp. S23]
MTVSPHGAFGALATLRFPGQPSRRFTLREASIVARALEAVASGGSLEREIYMSPIASDQDFEARVEGEGVVVAGAGCPDVSLAWPEAAELARALRAAAGE